MRSLVDKPYEEIVDKFDSFEAYEGAIETFFADQKKWKKVEKEHTFKGYETYLKQFKEALHFEEATQILNSETTLWQTTLTDQESAQSDEEKIHCYEHYLQNSSLQTYSDEARSTIVLLREKIAKEVEEALWNEVNKQQGTKKEQIKAFEHYLAITARNSYKKEAKSAIKRLNDAIASEDEEALWQITKKDVDKTDRDQTKLKAYQTYLNKTTLKKYQDDAEKAIVRLEEKIAQEEEILLWQKTEQLVVQKQSAHEKLNIYETYLKESKLQQFQREAKDHIEVLKEQIGIADEETLWKKTNTSVNRSKKILSKVNAYQNYLSLTQRKTYEKEAKDAIEKLHIEQIYEDEEVLWSETLERLKQQNDQRKIEQYELYLQKSKLHRYKKEAENAIEVLKNTIEEALWKEANSEQEDLEKYIENLGSYLENSVKKRYVEEAYTKKGSLQKEIANINENALWDKTTNRVNNTESNSEKIKAYEDYLDQTALHLHDNEAKEQLEELKKLEFIDTLAGIGVLAVIIIAIIAWIAD